MIIYIHGFASSGLGDKPKIFKKYFKNGIITPSLSTIPFLAIHTLEDLIEVFLAKGEKVSLVGSSLGGFYSLYLANKYKLNAVLINPALNPKKTLSKFYSFGLVKNYFDNSNFEITQEQLKSLENFQVSLIQNPKNIMALIQKGDEIIDYKESLEILKDCEIIVEEGGNHSFENIEKYLNKINNFFK
jgi:uncharacterized protein